MVTQYIKNATYKEIYDIHTDTESTSILTIHTPISKMPREMLEGFFKQYRRFRYRGVTLRMRPVARLPADPEQISYVGETGIDPRDLMDPVLFRGYSGESLGTFLNEFNVPGAQVKRQQAVAGGNYEDFHNDGFFGSSIDKASFFDQDDARDWRSTYLEKLYYQSLGDPGFKKIKPQGGFKKFLYPLTYELVTTTQRLAHNNAPTSGLSDYASNPGQLVFGRTDPDVMTGVSISNEQLAEDVDKISDMTNSNNSNLVSTQGPVSGKFTVATENPMQFAQSGSNTAGNNLWIYYRRTAPILTSKKRRLGFLDTDSVVVPMTTASGQTVTGGGTYADWFPPATVQDPANAASMDGVETNTTLPLINMGILIFPKAHKQEMHWRLELTHHFDFAKYRPMHGLVSPFDYSTIGAGPVLEWSDWDHYGEQVFPVNSVTSTSKNVEMIDLNDDVPVEDI